MPLNITGRNLYFKSGIDNKQLKKDAKAGNKEIDRMTKKVKKSGDTMAAGLKKAFKFIIGAVIVKKILDIGKALFKAGSEADEIRSKFEVTFQSINEEADKTAEALAKGFGLARVKAEELLSTTGDLLTGFGFSREAALETSNVVQQLAVDLASFNNLQGGAAQASTIITKALLGEKDSLVTLGVKILDSDIQVRLLEMGMNKLTGTALLQAKALITLNMIQEQSKNAIGDFARTSQSAANQQRILKENIKNLTINLSKRLVPAVGGAFIEMNKLVRSMVDMTEVKMSDTFKDEQVALNTLVIQITDANVSQEDRIKLIEKLQDEYPFFLENMKKEELTNENIAKRLTEINEAYIDKYIIQKQNEKIVEAADKLGAKRNKQWELWLILIGKISEAGIKLGITEELIGKDIYEQVGIIKEVSDARAGDKEAVRLSIIEYGKLGTLLSQYGVLSSEIIMKDRALNEVKQDKLEILKAMNAEEEELYNRTKIVEKKEEEPVTPEEKVPELTRIEAVTELNGLLKKQTELEKEVSKQLLKNRAKLKPFIASIKNLYADLSVATIKEGKQRLKMVDAMIEAETKAGRTIKKLLEERREIIEAMTNDIYAISDAMYGVSDVMSLINEDLSKLISGATQLVESLILGDTRGFFGGIVSVFSTLISMLGDQSESEAERNRLNEEFSNMLSSINRQLSLQLKLLSEINGTPWLVGAVSQVRNIETEMAGLLEQLQNIKIYQTTTGPLIDTSEWDINEWQDMIDNYEALGYPESNVGLQLVRERLQELIDAYRDQEDALGNLIDAYMQELTGTTTASIADSIAQGFSEGLDSAEVFADTFEDLMRNALIEALKRSLYDKGLEQFYENFYRAVESGGGLDEAEIERLKEEYNQILANAEAAWASMSELLGDEFALPGEEDPLVGAIKGLSEETAGVLAGQMMAIRINVAEGLEVAENSFLQLVEIADNTSYNRYLEQITAILQQNSEQALLRSGG